MALSRKEKVGVYLAGLFLGIIVVSMMPKSDEASPRSHWHEQTAPEGYYPYEYTDTFDRKAEFIRQPRHIISLAPSVTETLYAMGMGDHLMAVTHWCNYPAEAQLLKNTGGQIGAMDKPDIEAIIAYHPDVVIGSKFTPLEVYNLIEAQGKAESVALAWDRLEVIRNSMKDIGVMLGVPDLALELKRKLETEWNVNKSKLDRLNLKSQPNALFLLNLQEDFQAGWVAGSDSWIGDLLLEAGFENSAQSIGKSWGELSLENLLSLNPEILFIRMPEDTEKLPALKSRIETLKTHPVWSHLSAVKQDQIYLLSYGPFSIPGPRYVNAYAELVEARIAYEDSQSGQNP